MNKTKVWLVVAVLLILIGSVVFGGVMMKLKWDFTALSTTKYETNTTLIDTDYKNISVTTDTADIEFVISDSTKVVCHEEITAKHSVEVKDGTLFVRLIDERKWHEHIGINFGTPKITVYLPRAEYGIVSVKTSTGNITLENISAESLDFSVSTGRVTLSDLTCKDDVKVKVSTGKTNITDATCKNLITSGTTGDVVLKNVIATEKFSIERTTGDVKFDGCDANEIVAKTDTGSITGTLLTDKVFVAHTDTGRIDVPDTTNGGRCKITTDTGNVKITIAQ